MVGTPTPPPAFLSVATLRDIRESITVADRMSLPEDVTDEMATYRALWSSAQRLGHATGGDDGFAAFTAAIRIVDLEAALDRPETVTDDPT